MELKQIARIAGKWWWLVIVCTLLAAGISYAVSSYVPATYRASTSLLVSTGGAASPDYNNLLASQQLAATYVELLLKRPIVERTAQQLGLNPRDLEKRIQVRMVPNTTIIELTADDHNPQLAANIANGMVASFRQVMQESVGTPPRNLVVVEAAVPPTEPIAPRIPLNTGVAALVGLALSLGAVLAIEYWDDTLKTAEDVHQSLSAPVLAAIPYQNGRHKSDETALADPGSALADAHRALHIRIQPKHNQGLHSLLITSPSTREEKANVVANLAVAMAQAGNQVLLVDADLREPRLNKVFGLTNDVGLSTLLASGAKDWARCIAKTSVPNLRLLPAGPVAADPLGLLDTASCRRLIDELRTQADMILVNAPPVLAAADASSLASLVDGALLVIQSHATPRDAAAQALETLRNAQASVIGIVLNKVHAR